MKNGIKFSFHEASVEQIFNKDNTLIIKLKDVIVNSYKRNVKVNCIDVKTIKMDGERTEQICMAAKDGEVLTFECSDRELVLVIEWNDFAIHKSFTKAYQIECGHIEIQMID